MTRPETVADLSAHHRKGHHVTSITPSSITSYPSLGLHLLAAIAEAQGLGLEVDATAGEIRIPRTDEEMQKSLVDAQRFWDAGRDMYDQAQAGQPIGEEWQRYNVRVWAKGECLPVPEFDDDGVASWPEDEAVAE